SIWPYTQERSTTNRFLVDLGTGLPLISEEPLIHYGPSYHIRGGPLEVDQRRAVAWAGEKLYPEGHHCSSSLGKD
ncbi:hypothetical protein SAMN02745225_02326, partial [Ferrithrix thermotolerans DSM 19514]